MKPRPRCLLAMAFLALAGCVPEVVWLSDSSGFIFIAPQSIGPPCAYQPGPLCRYDLATKKCHILIANTAAVQPALSPDGKKIATADYDSKGRLLQLVFYDLNGTEQERTAKYAWPEVPGSGEMNPNAPALYWSPKGDHIAIYLDQSTGIYDIKTGAIKMVPSTTVAPIAGSPARPDGAGLLAFTSGKDPKHLFIDWQGNVQELKTPAKFVVGETLTDDVQYTQVTLPSKHDSRWEKNVALVGFAGTTLELDTDKLEVRVNKAMREMSKTKEGELIHSRYPLSENVEVRTVRLPPRRETPLMRVELLLPGAPPRKIGTTEMMVATPSPDGQWLALRFVERNDRVVLVNRNGEVIEVQAK